MANHSHRRLSAKQREALAAAAASRYRYLQRPDGFVITMGPDRIRVVHALVDRGLLAWGPRGNSDFGSIEITEAGREALGWKV